MDCHYIQTLSNYLGCADYLSFRSPPYHLDRSEQGPDAAHRLSPFGALRFFFTDDKGQRWGRMDVASWTRRFHADGRAFRDDKTFLIVDIQMDPEFSSGMDHQRGYGKERVRRAVLFAAEWGYESVETTMFSAVACSFWLGHGFRTRWPSWPLLPNWDRAGDLTPDIAGWKKKMKDDPDTLWDLARTELGRRVLFNIGGQGLLTFSDRRQCAYAFDRLGLT